MKTSQLQIRVSPEQKATIKELAKQQGMDISSFILSKIISPRGEQFHEILKGFDSGDEPSFVFAELNDYLSKLTPRQFEVALEQIPEFELSPFDANYLAAMIEDAAIQKGSIAPAWVKEIAPLAEPAFGSELKSLRLHLLLSSPPPFRRRNIFIDSSVGDRV